MANVRERKKIAKEIKKHRSLKTHRIEESIALDRHFKPLIEPLRFFVDSPGMRATKRESRNEDAASALKRERKEEQGQEKRKKKPARRSSVPRFCINLMIDRTFAYNR